MTFILRDSLEHLLIKVIKNKQGGIELIINYKRSVVKVEEVWSNRKKKLLKNADISIDTQLLLSPAKEPGLKMFKDSQALEVCVPNYLIDVRKEEDVIYQQIHKSTRADIRKAMEKDQLIYSETDNPTNDEITKFSSFYNSFARRKNIPLCIIDKLFEIRDHDSLIMTYVKDQQDNLLCASMLLVDKNHKQLYGLYGVSARLSTNTQKERNLIGRANKFLQWKEIKLAKKRGMDWYNFGGEVYQTKDKGVNEFKRRFGTIKGLDRRVYIPNSLLGRIYVFLIYQKWKKNFNTCQTFKYTGSGVLYLPIIMLESLPLPFI